jgi:hypothetical protein
MEPMCGKIKLLRHDIKAENKKKFTVGRELLSI